MCFYPKMYQKDIFHIDYDRLYDMGIRCLFFDLDNTVGLLDENVPSKKTISLFKKLSKKFSLVIISNHASKKRVSSFSSSLFCDSYHFAMKPSLHSFKKAQKKLGVERKEICMIGDQLLTDIFAANRFGCFSCLVDAMSTKDLKITSFNRFIEKFIYKKKKLKKGEYYG